MKAFKYVTPDRIDILKNQEIRFTQIKYLNDPFEFLPFISRLMDKSDAESIYKSQFLPILNEIGNNKLSIDTIPEEFRSLIPEDMLNSITNLTINEVLNQQSEFHPLTLITKFLTIQTGDFNTDLSKIIKENWHERFGVLSLASINNNITMWSHYAANHSGFVIQFDLTSSFFNKRIRPTDPIRHVRKVKYEVERPDIKLYDSNMKEEELLDFLAEKILLTKSIEWKYEEELRMICYLKETDNVIIDREQLIHLNRFMAKTINAVYLGVNSSLDFKNDVAKLLKEPRYHHVKLFHAVLNPARYTIDFEEGTF